MIKKDEYVRTKQGTIGQIIEKYEKYCVISNTRGEIDVPYENIAKHSKNIIDLIEVGDYVNGKEVVGKYYENNEIVIILDTRISTQFVKTKNKNNDIKTIVTKQQFSNMEYRV